MGVMSERIRLMRQTLYDKLNENSNRNWDYIIKQIGMFAYIVLNIRLLLGFIQRTSRPLQEREVYLLNWWR